ncbi:MAG: 2-succinyl-5-enolpyruvyl-6-hydroxy-3-cyclohexene-1-carboxylic-acid synthase [Opitutales bacterium]|nr:2-succinyl-5-enolpyruvyl-6-hydroxy-3-cyclohexene-1-carboxylic-acid synthase [Opitutales bacterium]
MEPRFFPEQLSNISSAWGALGVEALYRLGLRAAVISPGSRSTPLTFALARHPGIRCHAILDERAAAFFALGLAKQNHRPVALVCTSGTALAHYLPALIEARESQAPLLVLSADRPPELRHCRAGQTIDQLKIFGDTPRFFAEAPLPENTDTVLRAWTSLLSLAWERCQRPVAGPAHVNCPFREPLGPEEGTALELATPPARLLPPVSPAPRPKTRTLPESLPTPHGNGLLIAGPDASPDSDTPRAGVWDWSARTGIPVLVDFLHPARHGDAPADTLRVAHYDAILRSPQAAEALRPDWIGILGELPTSKVLRQWLGQQPVPRYIFSPSDDFRDATLGQATHLRIRFEEIAPGWTPPSPDPAYTEAWRLAASSARQALDTAFAEAPAECESLLYHLAGQTLPADVDILIASSLPVRDAEWFWPAGGAARTIYFNRGANGIDGMISTALGLAAGGQRILLIMGDLAAAHDLGGWLNRNQIAGTVVALVINNAGGGIFEHLPIAKWDPPFEEFFATPQDIVFETFAASLGIPHRPFKAAPQITQALADFPRGGVHLWEWTTCRKTSAATRKSLLATAADRLEKTFSE